VSVIPGTWDGLGDYIGGLWSRLVQEKR
jgi:hypothetical protein